MFCFMLLSHRLSAGLSLLFFKILGEDPDIRIYFICVVKAGHPVYWYKEGINATSQAKTQQTPTCLVHVISMLIFDKPYSVQHCVLKKVVLSVKLYIS